MSDDPPDNALFPSQRHTTSSRKPGVDVHGTVKVRLARLQICADCGSKWIATGIPGQHSPRWVRGRCGHQVKANCQGRQIGDCPECEREGNH